MSTRLQVVMAEEELEEIRACAARQHMTVSEWVRGVLREGRDRDARGSDTVREPAARYGDRGETLASRIAIEVEVSAQLLEAVQARYHLPNRRAAVEYALRRAAVTPMSKAEALEMQGVGWDADLGEMRRGDRPTPL